MDGVVGQLAAQAGRPAAAASELLAALSDADRPVLLVIDAVLRVIERQAEDYIGDARMAA